jgi:predicted Zn-dependent protease
MGGGDISVRNHLGMLPRLLLAACAILVLAWVGVLVRDHYVGESAAQVLLYKQNLSDREFERHIQRMADSRFLNPSSSADLARGTYYLVRGRPGAAARVAEALVHSEPENVDAWQLLWHATRDNDPARSREAAVQVKRLNPLATL